jgi:hypothetical protein
MNKEELLVILDSVATHIDAINAPRDLELNGLKSAVKSLETAISQLPTKGVDGKDGKDCDFEAVKAVIQEEVSKIPLPINGKDVDPEFVKSLVAEEVAKIPKPENGKDADITLATQLLQFEFDALRKSIPIPKDGIDGKDGKDADPEYIKSVIAEEVSKVPAAKDGKDADLSQVKAFIAEEVAKIDRPKDGVNGKDADLEVVKGFIQQEVKSIPIPKVESFTLEQVEKMVADAVAAAIANIPPAKDGEDGKDALAIQILPAIDESKSYPRGTFALHKNGTWRAYQKTVGMKGWECTQVGIAEIDIEMLDDRTLSIKTMLSNGEAQEKTLKLKNIKYKGVVAEGATYEEGDFVTWGGSIWHCDEPTSERPREGHKSWTLAVKKGRDYREPVKNDFDSNKPVKM